VIDILYTGGAKGADTIFSDCADQVGHKVYQMTFPNHKISENVHGEFVTLTEHELKAADPFLKQANKTLKRGLGRSLYVRNLLRRNYYQIKDTERVYAIAPIDSDTQLVEGGTAWAVTMAIDKKVPEIYVFDLNESKWFKYMHERNFLQALWAAPQGGWQPPYPHGKYTGIGSCELTDAGKDAIYNLYIGKHFWEYMSDDFKW